MIIHVQPGKIFKIVKKNLTKNPRPFRAGLRELPQDTVELKKTSISFLEYFKKFYTANNILDPLDAELELKKYGVESRFADFHQANLVHQAITNLKNAGAKVEGLQIDGFSSYNNFEKIFTDEPGKPVIYFDSKLDWLKSARNQSDYYNEQRTSSPHPLHEIYKEILDTIIRRDTPAETYASLNSTYKNALIYDSELNGAETTNFINFLSEVGAGLVGGQKYPKKVMALYEKIDQLRLKPAADDSYLTKYLEFTQKFNKLIQETLSGKQRPKLIRPNFKIPHKSLEYNGPYTIEECVEIARKLGINAEYTDKYAANFMTEALINMTKAGLDFSGLKICCVPYGNKPIFAEFKRELNTIRLNSDANWNGAKWKQIEEYRIKSLSTPSPLHAPYHELIHAAHSKLDDEGTTFLDFYWLYKTLKFIQRDHMDKVSLYAAKDEYYREFIAETGTGIICGKKYPKEILRAYKMFLGPELKIISTGEDFTSKYQKYLDSQNKW